jgi:hypothetical protein
MSVGTETDLAPEATAQKVFICYRRQDSAPYAGRIYDAMVAKFGIENVFMDLDLDPGVDFVERIKRVVSGCVALIVVIGPRWAELRDEDGGRRIEDPEDFVRLEVETGLHRDDVLLVPALVGGATMPRREVLPPELQTLARRNALELSEGRWAYDIGRLLDTLDERLPDPDGPTPRPAPRPRARVPGRVILEGMLVAAATATVVRLLGIPSAFEADGFAALAARRGMVFGLVGAALAIWLAWRVWRVFPLRHLLAALLIGALAGVAGGAIFGAFVYLPESGRSLDQRDVVDLLGFAVTGGILGALIGRLWRPPRIGPAAVAGACGGFLAQALIAILQWQDRADGASALRLGFVAASVTAMALAAMIAADRAEAREFQAVAGSPRSGSSHSDGSTGGIFPG